MQQFIGADIEGQSEANGHLDGELPPIRLVGRNQDLRDPDFPGQFDLRVAALYSEAG